MAWARLPVNECYVHDTRSYRIVRVLQGSVPAWSCWATPSWESCPECPSAPRCVLPPTAGGIPGTQSARVRKNRCSKLGMLKLTIPYIPHTISYTTPYPISYTVPHHTIPQHAIPYHTILYHTTTCHAIPHPKSYTTPCNTPYHTPYHTTPYNTIPQHAMPHHDCEKFGDGRLKCRAARPSTILPQLRRSPFTSNKCLSNVLSRASNALVVHSLPTGSAARSGSWSELKDARGVGAGEERRREVLL